MITIKNSNIIKEAIMEYTFNICNQDGYSFIISHNHNIDPMTDFTTAAKKIRCYSNEKIQKQINDFWSLCDTTIAINRIFNPLSADDKDNRSFPDDSIFFEKVWLQCKNQDEQNYFTHTMLGNKLYYYNFIKIDKLQNNEYKNALINLYFTQDNSQSSNNDDTLILLTNFVKNKSLKLTNNNLELMCQYEKRNLNKLSMQSLLKDFVEDYMPTEIEKVRSYWKKIDPVLVENEEFTIETPCYAIGFNKIQMYTLAPTENVDFFERRLQNLSTFLNKTATKKLIPTIERVVFDGIQDNQTHFRFIIFTPEPPTTKLKKFLTDLVMHNIQLTNYPSMDDLRKVVNYMLLEEKAESAPNTIKERTRKI